LKSDRTVGWQAFEAPGVEPVFPEEQNAIDYAEGRACFRSGEIRVLDSTGKLEGKITAIHASIPLSAATGFEAQENAHARN
jgi:hypothetical protein